MRERLDISRRVWRRTVGWVGGVVATRVLHKPEFAALFATRYPTPRSFVNDGVNQVLRLLRSTWALPPNHLIVELSSRCNLKCLHCPTHSEMTREQTLIDAALFRRIVADNPQLDRLVLMNWGEPLLHPDIASMIRYATDHGIETHLTTNGVLLDEETMNRLIDSGLTRIALSMDGVGETYERVRGVSYEKLAKKIEALLQIREERGAPLQVELNVTVFDETEDGLEALLERWTGRVDFVRLRPQEIRRETKRYKPCTEPWRTAVVQSNGKVCACSVDYDGVLEIGDARAERIRDIFNSERARALRQRHLRRELTSPCATCDEYQTDHVSPRFNDPSAETEP